MTRNEASRLADDMADDLRQSLSWRPNINRYGYTLRLIRIEESYSVGFASGDTIETFPSREAWEEKHDGLR